MLFGVEGWGGNGAPSVFIHLFQIDVNGGGLFEVARHIDLDLTGLIFWDNFVVQDLVNPGILYCSSGSQCQNIYRIIRFGSVICRICTAVVDASCGDDKWT